MVGEIVGCVVGDSVTGKGAVVVGGEVGTKVDGVRVGTGTGADVGKPSPPSENVNRILAV